jgi:LysM repeat protein
VALQKEKCGLLSAYSPDIEFHTVTKGETLAEIANHYGTTIVKLRELNEMSPRQYVRLKQGQTLRVRIVDHTESAFSKH